MKTLIFLVSIFFISCTSTYTIVRTPKVKSDTTSTVRYNNTYTYKKRTPEVIYVYPNTYNPYNSYYYNPYYERFMHKYSTHNNCKTRK